MINNNLIIMLKNTLRNVNECQGTEMMLNALYSGMHGIIAMKRNTCAKAEYVGSAKPR